MGYMKSKTSLTLLLLIALTLVAFTGFATYYQATFYNLSKDYEEKVGKIDELAETLDVEKTKLNQTSYQLEIKAEREKDLSAKYDTLRGVNDQLQKDKTLLQSELSTTKSSLAEAEVNLAAKEAALAEAEQTIATKESQIDNLEEEIDELNAEINSLCACAP